jgi:hypothetical protein
MADNASDQIINYMYDDDLYKDDDETANLFNSNLFILILAIPWTLLLMLFIICTCNSYICKENMVHSEPRTRSYNPGKSMIMDPNTVYVPEMCTICLSIYTDDDMITTLKCRHSFHKECINEWYATSTSGGENVDANCPCCNEVFIVS